MGAEEGDQLLRVAVGGDGGLERSHGLEIVRGGRPLVL